MGATPAVVRLVAGFGVLLRRRDRLMSATPGRLDFAVPAVSCMEYPVQLTLRRMYAQTEPARASAVSPALPPFQPPPPE